MAPAPYSRVPKGRFVEEPPAIPVQGRLVDVGDGSPATTGPTVTRRRSSVEAPLPRFQLRRSQGERDSISADAPVTRLGATDEIREHLKHLGPSNLASRPRQTRYSAVKIKRGSISSPSRSAQTSLDLMPSHPAIGLPASSDTDLTPGGLNPRDGAHALRMSSTPRKSPDSGIRHGPTVSIPEQVTEEQGSVPHSANSGRTKSPGSREQDGDQSYATSYVHRGPARSGSITEHIVDVNGIRKVVLHTTSSNSSSEAEAQPSRPKFPIRQGSEIIDLNETDGDHTDRSKKKRRRRRHKHHGSGSGSGSKPVDGNNDEDSPLLP